MTEEQKSHTMQTVEKLRAIADELEALADDFPNLTWYRAFHESLWNGDGQIVHQSGCFYKVMVDEGNVGRADRVWVGPDHASAFVELDSLSSDISVLYIHGLEMCHLPHLRDELVGIVQMLPEHLRLPIYRRMVQVRKEDREKKRRKREQLLRELEKLEDSS
jgi:hypothetical protein